MARMTWPPAPATIPQGVMSRFARPAPPTTIHGIQHRPRRSPRIPEWIARHAGGANNRARSISPVGGSAATGGRVVREGLPPKRPGRAVRSVISSPVGATAGSGGRVARDPPPDLSPPRRSPGFIPARDDPRDPSPPATIHGIHHCDDPRIHHRPRRSARGHGATIPGIHHRTRRSLRSGRARPAARAGGRGSTPAAAPAAAGSLHPSRRSSPSPT